MIYEKTQNQQLLSKTSTCNILSNRESSSLYLLEIIIKTKLILKNKRIGKDRRDITDPSVTEWKKLKPIELGSRLPEYEYG